VPQQAQFITQTFTNRHGSRDYKLFLPNRYADETLPLIVMLHGCTQSADDFAAGTRMNQVAEACRCLVAYPIQPPSANPTKCWNWFKAENQQRDGGEAALIADLTRHIAHNYAVDRKRIYVAGLSAGGAAAAILGTTYPDLYAAVGVHSGLACGAANDLSSALAVMRQGPSGSINPPPRASGFHGRARLAPTIVFHGARDRIVHPENAAQIVAQLSLAVAAEVPPVTHRGHVSGGHTYSRTHHLDASGRIVLEMWVIDGAGHAWSGGDAAGAFTDPRGPDASREMVRFFLQHPHPRDAQ
jgi:poly(hydroxyalkanoate) depolymerase family esterase